jgi:RNA recognition motif-containing protein
MNSKLYIGNLSYSTTEEALWNLFSQAGTVVSVDLITDRLSTRSKGYAFIVMSNAAEAERSIDMFNGMSLDDREISVSLAHRREDMNKRA